jgi:opacity protein-like surface antigen
VGAGVVVCALAFATKAALAQEQAPKKAAGGTLTFDLAEMQKPWTGDLDGMIERRVIRVLTVNSKTIHFLDKGVLRGTAVEYVRLFENELNKKLDMKKDWKRIFPYEKD